MFDIFEGNAEGCYLYSRHSSPMNLYLAQALAKNGRKQKGTLPHLEWVQLLLLYFKSVKVATTLFQLERFMVEFTHFKNFLLLTLRQAFVDINNFEAIENAIKPNTKVIYCESVSNPLLEVADLRKTI